MMRINVVALAALCFIFIQSSTCESIKRKVLFINQDNFTLNRSTAQFTEQQQEVSVVAWVKPSLADYCEACAVLVYYVTETGATNDSLLFSLLLSEWRGYFGLKKQISQEQQTIFDPMYYFTFEKEEFNKWFFIYQGQSSISKQSFIYIRFESQSYKYVIDRTEITHVRSIDIVLTEPGLYQSFSGSIQRLSVEYGSGTFRNNFEKIPHIIQPESLSSCAVIFKTDAYSDIFLPICNQEEFQPIYILPYRSFFVPYRSSLILTTQDKDKLLYFSYGYIVIEEEHLPLYEEYAFAKLENLD